MEEAVQEVHALKPEQDALKPDHDCLRGHSNGYEALETSS
jgi:hypothetical protein